MYPRTTQLLHQCVVTISHNFTYIHVCVKCDCANSSLFKSVCNSTSSWAEIQKIQVFHRVLNSVIWTIISHTSGTYRAVTCYLFMLIQLCPADMCCLCKFDYLLIGISSLEKTCMAHSFIDGAMCIMRVHTWLTALGCITVVLGLVA